MVEGVDQKPVFCKGPVVNAPGRNRSFRHHRRDFRGKLHLCQLIEGCNVTAVRDFLAAASLGWSISVMGPLPELKSSLSIKTEFSVYALGTATSRRGYAPPWLFIYLGMASSRFSL